MCAAVGGVVAATAGAGGIVVVGVGVAVAVSAAAAVGGVVVAAAAAVGGVFITALLLMLLERACLRYSVLITQELKAYFGETDSFAMTGFFGALIKLVHVSRDFIIGMAEAFPFVSFYFYISLQKLR